MSPYHNQGNGKAESAVKIAKNISKKSRNEDPYLALLAYRNTPHQGYDYSPAERLMSRKLRDIIPTATSQLVPKLACPRVVQENIAERRNRSKVLYNKKALTPLREFTEWEKVYLKPRPTNRSQQWIHGEVAEKPTPRSCVVKTAMGLVRRNHCQIRRAKAAPADRYNTVMGQLEIASTHSEQEQEKQPPNADSTGETMPSTPGIESEDTLPATMECGPRRSQRERRLPSRFRDYVM